MAKGQRRNALGKRVTDDGLEIEPGCPICRSPDRAGIETLGMLSFQSWRIAAQRINNTFGTHLTAQSVKKHMTEHQLHREAAERGILMNAMQGEEGSMAISPESLLDQLLVQGALDMARGRIKVKNVSELMSVITMLQNIQARSDRMKALSGADPAAFMQVMAAYAEAIRDTTGPEQLAEIVAKARALGAVYDITRTHLSIPDEVNVDDVMERAVEDYKEKGGPSTRAELVEAGVLDGVALPGDSMGDVTDVPPDEADEPDVE